MGELRLLATAPNNHQRARDQSQGVRAGGRIDFRGRSRSCQTHARNADRDQNHSRDFHDGALEHSFFLLKDMLNFRYRSIISTCRKIVNTRIVGFSIWNEDVSTGTDG